MYNGSAGNGGDGDNNKYHYFFNIFTGRNEYTFTRQGGNGGDGGKGGSGDTGGNGEGTIDEVNVVYGGTVFNGFVGSDGNEGEYGSNGRNGYRGAIDTFGGGGTAGSYGKGIIETLNVRGGTVYNGDDNLNGTGTIGTAIISDGTVYNGYCGYNNGTLTDYSTGTITTVVLSDGRIFNQGTIYNLEWTGGYFEGKTETLENLTLNVRDYGIYDWGDLKSATVNNSGEFNNRPVSKLVKSFPKLSKLFVLDKIGKMRNKTRGFRNRSNKVGNTITTATVNGGWLINYGAITDVTVNGWSDGNIWNHTDAVITIATLNEGLIDNTGTITTAIVNGGFLRNNSYNSITDSIITAIVNGGLLDSNDGSIGTATVKGGKLIASSFISEATVGGGILFNQGGNILTATVNGGLLDSNDGFITTAIVNNGTLSNQAGTSGTMVNIDDATVNDGLLENIDGYIITATVNNGTLRNEGHATIERATVNGGTLNNGNGATIDTATQKGGTINNGGRIEELNYVAGDYNGKRNGATGTIGTLNVSTDVTSMDFGRYGNVNVYDGGILYNDEAITTATVNGFLGNSGTIRTAIVNSGTLENNDGGQISFAAVEIGQLINSDTITDATINSGTLSNLAGGHINTTHVNGGELNNESGATIDRATQKGGTLTTSGTVGTVTVDGGTLSNKVDGNVVTATVNGGTLNNESGAAINRATQEGGTINNGGRIGELNYVVGDYNGEHNGKAGTIGTFNVSTDVSGRDFGKVENANVHNGGTYDNKNAITKAEVNNGGWLRNANQIGTANVNGGAVDNRSSITEATVNAGNLNNWNGGTLSGAEQYGGTISNGGQIDILTYFGGDYHDSYVGMFGSIGTLTLAGDASGISWGNVGNIVFAEGEQGVLSFTAADLFSSVSPQNIDLTYGNLLLDLSDSGSGDSFLTTFADGFSFASLFGLNEEDIMGELNSFEVALGEDADWEGVFALLDSSVFESGWNYSETSTGAVWERNDALEPSPTPEPATLVIFGVGLAGAGVAALCRRKK